jgi:hypothetical protein
LLHKTGTFVYSGRRWNNILTVINPFINVPMYQFYFVKLAAWVTFIFGKKCIYKSTDVPVLLCKTGGVGTIFLR